MDLTLKEKVFKATCEGSFNFFAKHFVQVVEKGGRIEWNWHHTEVCRACQNVYDGTYSNLDINIPPRTLKSLLVNVLFPTWMWIKNPTYKILSASGSYDLASGFSLARRDLVTSDEFQHYWNIKLKEDKNTITEYHNVNGGFMKAISAMGKVTGKGGDICLSDDLLDATDAFSKTKRDAVIRWFSQAFYNRVNNKKTAKRININQRLHEEDVSGYIRKNLDFERLVLPMIKTKENHSTIDVQDKRQIGEYLQPTRYSVDEMEDDYKALGTYGWSGQYQQSPNPLGGGIIKNEWIRYYRASEKNVSFQKTIIVADLTFKGGEGSDFACFACWGKSGNSKYLIDMVRGKWSYLQTKEMFKNFCAKHRAGIKWIEDKANGPALISDLKDEITGLYPWPKKGSKYMNADKVQRLYMVSEEYELGNVYLPEDLEITDAFVHELLSFTDNGSTTGHDDMVDASTMALIELKTSNFFAIS